MTIYISLPDIDWDMALNFAIFLSGALVYYLLKMLSDLVFGGMHSRRMR